MSCKRAFSLVEILVVTAIIGVVLGLLFPAIQRVRDAGHKTVCSNNMRQLGLALTAYHDEHRRLPCAEVNQLSGFVLLLPYLEQNTIYQRYNLSQGWTATGTQNASVIQTQVPTFVCPADPRRHTGGYGTTNYKFSASEEGPLALDSMSGVSLFIRKTPGAFGYTNGSRFSDFKDGKSNTLLMGEGRQTIIQYSTQPLDRLCYWGIYLWWNPSFLGVPSNINEPFHVTQPWMEETVPNFIPIGDPRWKLQLPNIYGSWHPGGAHFLFADGSVHFLTNATPSALLWDLTVLNDGKGTMP